MGKIILNNIEYGTGTPNSSNVDTTNLVKKDNIVTVIDENVTDEQIPSAKAVHTVIQNVNVSVPVNTYTKEEVDNLLNTKVDTDDLVDAYSKDEMDNLLDSKVNTDDLVDSYSKTEVDTLLTGKADSSSIIDAYNKTEVDNLLANKADSSAIEETKTELENEIANIPKVTKTSELTNDSGYITASDIPTTLPASDVYAWAKASTKPTYTASEVGALPSNGTAVNASKVANALTISLNGTSQGAYNGSSAKNINITASSVGALPNVGAGGVNELGQYLDLHKGGSSADYDARIHVNASNQIVHADANGTLAVNYEINNLKNTVVDGKTSVANAINGKLGTTLSNQTSFADMAYYIGTIPTFSVENLYVGGSYLSTPSGVGIKYVIFNTISKSPASSHSDGYVTAEFTNNAQNAYRRIIIKGNNDGTRNVTTLKPKTITRTGTVTANLSFPEADSDVGTMITIAVFDNPIYDVKALTGDYFICIP